MGSIWLVVNAASGSNDAASQARVRTAFIEAGLSLDRVIRFPDENMPTAAQLDRAGIEILVVFTGDGSISAAVTGLAEWDGALLALPGGTMNLLSHRLHGDAEETEIIGKCARGKARRVRPPLVRSQYGDALTGVLAGPGTKWNEVREDMRYGEILEFADHALEAIEQSISGPAVVCEGASGAQAEGYPLIMLTPVDRGIEIKGFYAETIGDFAKQGFALLRRSFREGPHDDLGVYRDIVLSSRGGEPVGLLLDGEPVEGGARVRFRLACCEVDLLATDYAH